jgi:glutaminase
MDQGSILSNRKRLQISPVRIDSRTGLRAKSGVGGGLIAVSPGKFGIAVVSPPLDDAGNSVRAQRAITDISNALGGNPYSVKPR